MQIYHYFWFIRNLPSSAEIDAFECVIFCYVNSKEQSSQSIQFIVFSLLRWKLSNAVFQLLDIFSSTIFLQFSNDEFLFLGLLAALNIKYGIRLQSDPDRSAR